jgi:hypothetical protein
MIAYRPEQLQQLNAARALDRSLLEQQNAEFRASEERDRQRLEEERKKQEHTALVEARRTFLAGAIKPEPAATVRTTLHCSAISCTISLTFICMCVWL